MNKKTIDLICCALLSIVAALRKEYGLPIYQNIIIEVRPNDSVAGAIGYNQDMAKGINDKNNS